MDFGNILSTTWKIIWKHKVIIWFGLVMIIAPALLGILVGGVFAFSTPESIEAFLNSSFDESLFLLFVTLAYIAFIGLSFALYALSLAGVLKGTIQHQGKDETLSFGELWDISYPYLGRIVGVLLVVGLALTLVFTLPIFFGALIGALTAGIGFLCMMPLLLLIIPLGLLSYLLLALSTAAVVVDDLGVFDAIRRAWALLRAKFWPLVLMAIILYFAQMVVSMVIMIPMQFLQFAFIIPMSSGEIDPDSVFRIYGIVMAFFIPISTLFQSFGLTYVNAAWALTYLNTTSKEENNTNMIEYA